METDKEEVEVGIIERIRASPEQLSPVMTILDGRAIT